MTVQLPVPAATPPPEASRAAHALTPAQLAAALASDLDRGLEEVEAQRRLAECGPNRPHEVSRPPYARLALDQLLDPLVLLLLAASLVSIAIGNHIEGAAIAAILVLNGILGFWQEAAAERAVRSLSQAFTQSAHVVRSGKETRVDAECVVPGDVLVLAEGDRVAADARLLSVSAIEVDESALTGESLPVGKHPLAVAAETPLAERTPMVYAGSAVTRGHAHALVCATGQATELGGIERLTAAARPPTTPLERRLSRLARQMVVLGVVLTVTLAGLLLVRGEPAHEAFLLGVAVAVAAVPEGLAAIVTAALALGGRAMATRGAIVRRLEAIETLGETTVVCSDKTGTLTQNRIHVAALKPARGFDERELLVAAALASSARETAAGFSGDPIEVALLQAAASRGVSLSRLLAERDLLHEIPFDAYRKRMTTVYAEGERHRVFSKGAPEMIAAARDDPATLEAAAAWAGEGLRVLAIAAGFTSLETAFDETVEEELELVGIVALHDPLRPTAKEAVAAARAAGLDVRMLTGDHPATARTIGLELGLDEQAVVARATPAEKLALVSELQEAGEIVAVTGDGVNDAPALRKADVGVAMGLGGTEAAREAAGVVLTDDDFATIVAAVAEGRRIGDNIRKFVAFLLSANLGEVVLFAVAVAAGLDPPLAVIQVLLINLMTDGLPALALARDPASELTMQTPPRRGDYLFDRRTWSALAFIGLLVGAASTAAYLAGTHYGGDSAQTMAFTTLALSELVLVFSIRSPTLAAWRLPSNKWLDASVLASVGFLAGAIYLPLAHEPFATVSLPLAPALTAVALATVPSLVVETTKRLRTHRHGNRYISAPG
ncbi:MAG TPA: cation-transporting P-type ATPase [Gaiellaceae bacterium]|nr:cation-transporting P-type ATPase [Gaiellaceae bacterium]